MPDVRRGVVARRKGVAGVVVALVVGRLGVLLRVEEVRVVPVRQSEPHHHLSAQQSIWNFPTNASEHHR